MDVVIREFKTYFTLLFSKDGPVDISFGFGYDKRENKIFLHMEFEANSADLFYKHFGENYKKRFLSKVILATMAVCEAGLDIFVSEGDIEPEQEKQIRIVSDQPAAKDLKNLLLRSYEDIKSSSVNPLFEICSNKV